MKQFFKYISLVVVLLLLVAGSLDFVYTSIYQQAKPRTKFQYFRSLTDKKIDYVFLGSSRVENGVNANLIQERTGKSAVNMGFQAAKMSDLYVLLKLIKEYNIQTEKIFVQVDYIYNIENGYSNILQYEMMPFLRENAVTKDYFELHFSDDKMLYYFPFYRYCAFDAKIGFRELLMNAAGKATSVEKNKGFNGLKGVLIGQNMPLPNSVKESNRYLDQIKAYAKTNKMNVVFYCAPFHPKTQNLSYISGLSTKFDTFYNFSSIFQDDNLFKDYSHLNVKGADAFSEYLITHLLNK